MLRRRQSSRGDPITRLPRIQKTAADFSLRREHLLFLQPQSPHRRIGSALHHHLRVIEPCTHPRLSPTHNVTAGGGGGTESQRSRLGGDHADSLVAVRRHLAIHRGHHHPLPAHAPHATQDTARREQGYMWERCAHWIFSKKCLAACACPSRLTTLSWPSSSVNRIPSEPSSSNVQKTGPGGGRLPPVLLCVCG